MKEIGQTFADRFKNAGVTKVVTLTSGIAPALYVAEALDVPMIFAKKAKNITMNREGFFDGEVVPLPTSRASTVFDCDDFGSIR